MELEPIHPSLWTGELPTLIRDQTIMIVRSQFEAADRIIVSQDRIASEINNASFEIGQVAEGLESLEATFEWGFSELFWQLEQQRETLGNILKVLQAPLSAQAKELKKRAENAYRHGWIDDALEDFLESEKKNRYDFTIHQSLGNIYLFHKKDPNKALEYYEKALKYATPYSPYYASFALLHIGLENYLLEDFQEAYNATSRAIELSPNYYESYYQHARYCAMLGKYDEAIEHLEQAIIEGDRYYCIKADSDECFDEMREKLQLFFGELRDKLASLTRQGVFFIQGSIRDAESDNVSSEKLDAAKKILTESITLMERETLFDCWDANYKITVAEKMVLDSSVEHLNNIILNTGTRYNNERTYEMNRPTPLEKFMEIISIIGVLGLMIMYFTKLRSYPSINWSSPFVLQMVILLIMSFSYKLVTRWEDSQSKRIQESRKRAYDDEIAIYETHLSAARTAQSAFYIEEAKSMEDPIEFERFLRQRYNVYLEKNPARARKPHKKQSSDKVRITKKDVEEEGERMRKFIEEQARDKEI